jgi:hypothetical protein
MNNLILGTGLLGTGVGITYYNWAMVRQKCIWFASRSMDHYVDLKWRFLGDPDVCEHVKDIQLQKRCISEKHDGYVVYNYSGNSYITFAPLPPTIYDIESQYNDDEMISSFVVIWKDGSDVEQVEVQRNHLLCIIMKLAGPLYDFHNAPPSLAMIKTIDTAPWINNIKKIIINTDYFKEYILE